jgi:ribosome-associated protein
MQINDLNIPDEELQFSFARSGGPGGQNVNKVASKAILHWNVNANATLPPDVKQRLRVQQAGRISADGFLVIQSQRYRDQPKNIDDCRQKLSSLIIAATFVPKPRKATRPTKGAKERRLTAKKQQSQRKASRGRPGADD